MLRTKGFTRSYIAHCGINPVLDPEWDDYQPPQLILATCFEQFEGGGRNGLPVGDYLHRPHRRYQKLVSLSALVVSPPPAPALAPTPRPAYRGKPPWAEPRLQEVRPLHPFCMRCGYRKGGPDSWSGHACKCGFNAAPLLSHTGEFCYGVEE